MSGHQVSKSVVMARCKGCGRRCRLITLSASMLCGACLSEAFTLSWAKVTGAITTGASDCAVCAIAGVDQVAGRRERRHKEHLDHQE